MPVVDDYNHRSLISDRPLFLETAIQFRTVFKRLISLTEFKI